MSRRAIARVGLAAAVLVVVAALGVTGDAAATDHTEEAVVVGLDESGDATLMLTVTFGLTDSEERTDFEEFRADQQRQEALLDRYESRLTVVSEAVNAETNREMRVVDPRLDSRATDDGSVGVVAVTVTWENLAAIDGDRLRLTSPFDDGFASDRTVVVEAPDEYRTVEATPEPAVSDHTATWDADRVLDGFVLTAAPADGAGDTDATSPGFGLLLPVVAALALAILRRTDD